MGGMPPQLCQGGMGGDCVWRVVGREGVGEGEEGLIVGTRGICVRRGRGVGGLV